MATTFAQVTQRHMMRVTFPQSLASIFTTLSTNDQLKHALALFVTDSKQHKRPKTSNTQLVILIFIGITVLYIMLHTIIR